MYPLAQMKDGAILYKYIFDRGVQISLTGILILCGHKRLGSLVRISNVKFFKKYSWVEYRLMTY